MLIFADVLFPLFLSLSLRAFSFLETGGLDILLSWLDPSSNSAPVLSHTLDALSILPLTSSHLESHPSLLSTLTALRSHADESISQSADDLLATLERQRREGNDKEEEDVADDAGTFRRIKIDKSTAEGHSEPHRDDVAPVKQIAFEEAISPPASPDEGGAEVVQADKERQAAMEREAEGVTASAVPAAVGLGKKRKRAGLCVSWAEEDALESVRLFFKEEPIVKREKKKSATFDASDALFAPPSLPSTPLTPTLDWYPPPKLTLPPLIQTQLAARGQQSTERPVQRDREKSVLRVVYIPGHELPLNPSDSPEVLNPPVIGDEGVVIIPFDPPKWTAPESSASSRDNRPPGSDSSMKTVTVELLSKLSSLASLLTPGTAASHSGAMPSGAATSSWPAAPVSSSSSPSLSSAVSSLPAPSTYPPPSFYPAPYAPAPSSFAPSSTSSAPPAPAGGASSSSTSKLLSLLSNKSAVSGLTAAFQTPLLSAPAPAPAAPLPIPQPAPYSLYAAPQPPPPAPVSYPPMPSYAPPPPPPASYPPPPSSYPPPPPPPVSYPQAQSSYYPPPAQAAPYPSLPQVSIST